LFGYSRACTCPHEPAGISARVDGLFLAPVLWAIANYASVGAQMQIWKNQSLGIAGRGDAAGGVELHALKTGLPTPNSHRCPCQFAE
jgi:hypothetical protein